MGLRLRADVVRSAVPGGVFFLTHRGPVSLRGESVHLWIDRLAPHLNGTHSLAELTAGLPADRGALVSRLITTLLEADVLVDEEPVPETAGHRRFRDGTVLVAGAGPLVPSLVAALELAGSGGIRVLATDGVTAAAVRGAEVHRYPDEPEPPLTGVAMVVHLVGSATDPLVATLEQHCAAAGVPVLRVALIPGAAWIGPFGPVRGGWDGLWRRLVTAPGGSTVDDSTVDGTGPGTTARTVLAGQLAQHVLREVGGVLPEPDRPTALRFDHDGLRSERYSYLPHPSALPAAERGAAALLARAAELERLAELDEATFSARVIACVGARTGLLGPVREDDLAQTPLFVSRTEVSDPMGLLGATEPPRLARGGLSFTEARCRTALDGLAVYASLAVDPRALHRPGGDPFGGDKPPAELATARVWALGLPEGDAVELPAAQAFPVLGDRAVPYRPPIGTAAGYSWEEALRTGLLAHCRARTLAELATATAPRPVVDPEAIDPGSRWRSLAGAIGRRVTIHDVTGSLRVPTLAFLADERVVVCASGGSWAEALRTGYRDLLLWHQAEVNGQPGYAPPAISRFAVSGTQPHWSPGEPEVRLTAADLATRLGAAGHRPCAVPLDHDPEVASIMPFLVHVLLREDERSRTERGR